MGNEPAEIGVPDLGPKTSDRVATIGRVAASMVPIAGGVLAELISEFIPNQRIERIEKFLNYLHTEIQTHRLVSDQIKTPVNASLVKDGDMQAIRALSDERLHYLAHCVAEGLPAPNTEKLNDKRILNTISELDDREILILNALSSRDASKFEALRPSRSLVKSPPEDVLIG
jgi:hypothetical protein